MKFNKLYIMNVGNFSGRHEFLISQDGASTVNKPIILFGGLNGAGKTTLFDAIKLCLYGQELFGSIPTLKYHEYLKDRIHHSKATPLQPHNASIEIEFEYTNFGGLNTYHVQRMWEIYGNKVKEILSIKRNGSLLDDVEKGSWQDFIKEMIPLGLSQLFFFDGEKIQKMMFDRNSQELKSSILSLLGLDLVERLQSDLKIYRTKLLKESSKDIFSRELSILEKEKSVIEAEIRMIKDEKAELENNIGQLRAKIADYKSKISAQGEGYFRNRVSLEEKKKALESDIESLRDKLRTLAGEYLPITVASSYALKLKEQVEGENQSRTNDLVNEALRNKYAELISFIDSNSFRKSISIKADSQSKVKELIKCELTRVFTPPVKQKSVKEIFGFSHRQVIDVMKCIDVAVHDIPLKLRTLTDEYERQYRELQDIVAQLAKVPDDSFIQPMYETLEKLNEEMGALIFKKDGYDEQITSLTNRRNELQRKIDQLTNKLEATQRTNDKIGTVAKVEKVLSKYHRALAISKISQLQEEFTKIFNMLHRKGDLISKIEVDPESFDVTLFDANNIKINKDGLSSGELEIYAMAMLWALAKTSGQKLPFIIDTPLARLDSKHRDNLVRLFFPHASHQMIIFSTNTEVDKQYFEILKPHVAQVYNLEYSNETKSTSVKRGYFWN